MIRILKHFIFTFIVTAITFTFGCRASDPIPQRISAPIVSVEDIINDTKEGNQSYEGKIVKVNGTVVSNSLDLIKLETGSSISSFYISHEVSPIPFLPYYVDENYDFTLYIDIQNNYIIKKEVFANLASTEIIQVTIESLEDQMGLDSKIYVGYPIRLTAKIEIDDFNRIIKIVNGEGKLLLFFSFDENTYIEGQTYTFLLFVYKMSQYEVNVYLLKP